METIEVIISQGTRNRIERIKKLRREAIGIILDDQEIITAAIAVYWQAAEERARKK